MNSGVHSIGSRKQNRQRSGYLHGKESYRNRSLTEYSGKSPVLSFLDRPQREQELLGEIYRASISLIKFAKKKSKQRVMNNCKPKIQELATYGYVIQLGFDGTLRIDGSSLIDVNQVNQRPRPRPRPTNR